MRNSSSYDGGKTLLPSNVLSPSPFVGIRGLLFSPPLVSSSTSTPEVGGMLKIVSSLFESFLTPSLGVQFLGGLVSAHRV